MAFGTWLRHKNLLLKLDFLFLPLCELSTWLDSVPHFSNMQPEHSGKDSHVSQGLA